MIGTLLVLALAQAAPVAPQVTSVQVQPLGTRTALVFVSNGLPLKGRVERRGGEAVILVDAASPAAGTPSPRPLPPLTDVRILPAGPPFAVRVRVAADVVVTSRSEANRFVVVFGSEVAVVTPQPSPPPDMATLYGRLFPVGSGVVETGVVSAPPTADAEDEGGITPLHLQPSVVFSYIRGESAFRDDPTPVPESYAQALFSLSGRGTLGLTRVLGNYSAFVPRGGSTPGTRSTTHVLDLTAERPLTERTSITVTDHFVSSRQHVRQVDPGGEYFFDLGRFQRNDLAVGTKVAVGARTIVDLTLEQNRVRFSERSGFFGYTQNRGIVGVLRDVSPRLQLRASQLYERVPRTEERAEAESRVSTTNVGLLGELFPLTTAEVTVGLTTRTSPSAPPAARRFRQTTANARLKKDFSPMSSASVSLVRTSYLSAFELNPFYRSTALQGLMSAGLPLSLSLKAGTGYYWNSYPLDASAIGVPREDHLFGWSVGLGRGLTRRAFVRADYHRERRRSNVPNLSNTTNSVILQLGVGLFDKGGEW